MAINLTVNGSTFSFPEVGDTDWGLNVTDWASAVTSGMLQKAGGNFTLLADVNFGATYGLVSTYYKSRGTNIADSGVVRLANAESISWRNNANGANLGLSVNSSDQLTFNGNAVVSGFSVSDSTNIDLTLTGFALSASVIAGSLVNADISNSAAIAQSKLNLSITNSEVNASAAIAQSKLALSITNSEVDAAAAIAYSKLNLTSSIVNSDISNSAAIAYSKLNLTTSIVNADISNSAAIAYSKLATLSASRALQSSAGGFIEASSVTSTELGYVAGVTSALQTQLDGKEPSISVLPIAKGGTNNGSLLVTAGGVPYTNGTQLVNVGAGSSGQYLRSNGASAPTWSAVTSTAAFNYTAQSSTYAAVINDYVLASGASFTITLPTAVGVSGQLISIQHAGTSLTQAYTLNTTSGQTIGGVASGSYVLHTNSEVLQLVSDGANWLILNHKTLTGWTSYTPTLTGFGSCTNVSFRYKRSGDTVEVLGFFTAGAPTSVEARISLPGSLTSTFLGAFNNLIGDLAVSAIADEDWHFTVICTDSLNYVTFGNQSTNNGLTNQLGSTIFVASQSVSLYFRVPVSGWQP